MSVVPTPDRLVGDVMTEHLWTLTPDDDLRTAMELMLDKGIRHLPIVDEDGTLVGLLSHRDLLAAAPLAPEDAGMDWRESLEEQRIADTMERGVETVEPGDTLRDAADLMLENKYGCVPVLDGDRLVGILTESDFVRLVGTAEE